MTSQASCGDQQGNCWLKSDKPGSSSNPCRDSGIITSHPDNNPDNKCSGMELQLRSDSKNTLSGTTNTISSPNCEYKLVAQQK
jgi:hypothetical protein